MISEAQKRAGNYAKKHVRVAGLEISIENRKGAFRCGTGKDGKEWRVKMPCDYGYIKGTLGRDGDHVDCFLGPLRALTDESPVWVMNQMKEDGKTFDEHKILLGFRHIGEAWQTYLRAYNIPMHGRLVAMTLGKLKEEIGKRKCAEPMREFSVIRHAGELSRLRKSKPWLFKKSVITAADRANAVSPAEASAWSLGLRRQLGMVKKEFSSRWRKVVSAVDVVQGKTVARKISIGKTPVGELRRQGGEITGAFVDPKFRGMGVGKKIYGDLLAERGKLSSDFSVTEAAQRVWRSIGRRRGAEVTKHPSAIWPTGDGAGRAVGADGPVFSAKVNWPRRKAPAKVVDTEYEAREALRQKLDEDALARHRAQLAAQAKAHPGFLSRRLTAGLKEMMSKPAILSPTLKEFYYEGELRRQRESVGEERGKLVRTGILAAGVAAGGLLAGRALRPWARKEAVRTAVNKVVGAQRSAKAARAARSADFVSASIDGDRARRAAAAARVKSEAAVVRSQKRVARERRAIRKDVLTVNERRAGGDLKRKEFSERSAAWRDYSVAGAAGAAGAGVAYGGWRAAAAAKAGERAADEAHKVAANVAAKQAKIDGFLRGAKRQLTTFPTFKKIAKKLFSQDEGGIPFTGKIAKDRYIKKVRDEDLDRRDANILRAGTAGAAVGALMPMSPMNRLVRPHLTAVRRGILGAGLGAAGVLGVRAVTKRGRDPYGERSRGGKRAEGIPAAAAIGAAGYLGAKKLRLFEGKRKMNPYLGAAASGAVSGALIGAIPLLRRGSRVLPSMVMKKGLLGAPAKRVFSPGVLGSMAIGAGASAGVVGGGAMAGSKILGDPKPDEGAAYTKRAAVGGGLAGAALGLTGGILASKTRVGRGFLAKAARTWRPAIAARKGGPIAAAAIGAVAGGAIGSAQGADEGQQVDSIINLRKDMKKKKLFSLKEFRAAMSAGDEIRERQRKRSRGLGIAAGAYMAGSIGIGLGAAYMNGKRGFRMGGGSSWSGGAARAGARAGANPHFGTAKADKWEKLQAMNRMASESVHEGERTAASKAADMWKKKYALSRRVRGAKEFGFYNQPREDWSYTKPDGTDGKGRFHGRFANPVRESFGVGAPGMMPNPGESHPATISQAQMLRGFYREGKGIHKWGGRAARLVGDTGAVLAGKPRRRDASGRPTKREWEKSWFKNAAGSAATAAGLAGAAVVTSKTKFGRSQIQPRMRRGMKWAEEKGFRVFETGKGKAGKRKEFADRKREQLRDAVIAGGAGVGLNVAATAGALSSFKVKGDAAADKRSAKMDRFARRKGFVPSEGSGRVPAAVAPMRSGIPSKFTKNIPSDVADQIRSGVRAGLNEKLGTNVPSGANGAFIRQGHMPDFVRAHEAGHVAQKPNIVKSLPRLGMHLAPFGALTAAIGTDRKNDRKATVAAGLLTAAAVPTLHNEVDASVRGYKVMRKLGGSRLRSAGAFVGLPTYAAIGAMPAIGWGMRKARQARQEKKQLSMKFFDEWANFQGWDVRDARGRSARVFAPGSRKRMRRDAEWHETKDGQRKIWQGMAVAGTLAGIGAGFALRGTKAGTRAAHAVRPRMKVMPDPMPFPKGA